MNQQKDNDELRYDLDLVSPNIIDILFTFDRLTYLM